MMEPVGKGFVSLIENWYIVSALMTIEVGVIWMSAGRMGAGVDAMREAALAWSILAPLESVEYTTNVLTGF